MRIDLRIPVGLVFSLIGIILTAFGYATNSHTSLYERSLGINVNLWWGIVLLVFGQVMFQLGRRAQMKTEIKNQGPARKGERTIVNPSRRFR